MKLLEVTAYNLKSQKILNESWTTLTESQRMYVSRWEKELWPLLEQYTKLCEAALTPAQIQQIFQSAEDTAMASGTNTSTLGKVGAGAAAAAKLPIELTKQINAKIDELGRLAQKAGPVKAMDQKFDQLKNTINKKFPDSKILDGISEIGIWAKENPGKASLAIGILTTIAALAGGPAGGAAAGLLLRGTKDLLAGEKLSTAIGKGVKTAALGFIAGKAFEMLGNWMAGFREQSIPFGPSDAGLEQVSWGATKTISSPGMEWTRTTQGFDALVRPEEAEAIRNAMAGIKAGDSGAFDSLLAVAKEVNSKDYKAGLDTVVQGAFKAAKDNDSLLQFINTAKDGLQAGSQGAIAAADANKKPNAESVSMEDKYDQYLQEGPMDALKKVGGAIKTKAAAVGKELGNKVTVAKLMKQWKAMGEPTDTGSVMNILQSAGLSDEQIGQIGQTTKVDLKSTAQPTAAVPAAGSKSAPGAVDLKSLADEIKKAGPEVIEAVKAMLASGAKARSGGKVAGQVSQTPDAIRKRNARAAKTTTSVTTPAKTKTVPKKPALVKPSAKSKAKPNYATPPV